MSGCGAHEKRAVIYLAVRPNERDITSLLSPPSSSTVQVPVETSLHLLLEAQDQRLGAEHDQLPCGSTGMSSGNCQ